MDEEPFSVRLRNDSFLLRSLLKPPLSESSLGEPGIMFVWNKDVNEQILIIILLRNDPGTS